MATPRTFTFFNELPKELRHMIWELALQPLRIVHLTRRQVATSKDPVWWKRVWSDTAIDEPDYGLFDVEETWIDEVERKLAAKLLASDDTSWGWMTRTDARNLLQRKRPSPRVPRIWQGDGCPEKLYGFDSEASTPDALFACRESLSIGHCFPAFGSQGAVAQTYINYKQDILYLDRLSTGRPFASPIDLTNLLGSELDRDELAQIENLAIRWLRPGWVHYSLARLWKAEDLDPNGDHDSPDAIYVYLLFMIQKYFPNLKRFIIVDGHYTHRDRQARSTDLYRAGKDYEDLKILHTGTDSKGSLLVNGLRFDASMLRGNVRELLPNKSLNNEYLESHWGKHGPWRLPKIEWAIIASSADERQLIYEARLFENLQGHIKEF
jgi:2EXR family